MSIKAKTWTGGGSSASVPDASETTKGKIQIATSAAATTGTDDLKAMTPLTVKERIDAALVGGVEYKGTWNATTGLPTLINAVQGDLYKVDTLGTIYGKVWAVGDQLIINDDMGGSITNSKIDKIDNTEAVTSVNGLTGPVLLSMDNIHDVVSGSSSSGDLLMYDGNDWNNTAKSSIAVSAFNDDNTYLAVSDNLSDLNNVGTARTNLGLGTASTKDTGVANGNVIVADATGLPVIDGSQLTGITATDATKLAIANNLSDLNNVGTARTNLGLGTASTSASSDFLAVSNNLSDLNNVGTARTNLGLGTASTKDTGVANGNVIIADATGLPVIDGSQLTGITATDSTKLAISNNLSDLNNVGTARTNLGLVIGTNVQAYDPGLTSIAGLTTAADKMIFTDGSDSYAVTGLTSAGRALLDDADASAQRTTLGLAIGTNVQAYDAGLTSIAGLTTAADKMIFTDGSDSYAVTGLTSAGRALLDDADASAQRTTLGLVIGTDVAPIAAPAFTGNATAVTQSQSDGSTKIATTAYVDTAVAGASGYTYSAKTASFTAAADYHYSCTNAITATLPAASSNANKPIRIKVMGTGTVTIARDGSDKIDGVASDYSMTIQYSSITLFSNGSDGWEII
jgi:CRISPR/Cas system CMR subunit Cmr6 (Cas7 group RAMP superfamily)